MGDELKCTMCMINKHTRRSKTFTLFLQIRQCFYIAIHKTLWGDLPTNENTPF